MVKRCDGILLGIPVYNEQAHVTKLLGEVRDFAHRSMSCMERPYPRFSEWRITSTG